MLDRPLRSRSLSDIGLRNEAKKARPDERHKAWKNRKRIHWNTLRIFSGRARRRWSWIIRRSRTASVGQAPNSTAPLATLLLILAGCSYLAPVVPAQASLDEPRVRARALGIVVGSYEPGPLNAITDVAGVSVGQTTLISGDGPLKPGLGPIRTGVTVVIPRDDVWHKKVPAGSFVLNGTGEMTGLSWVTESGFLEYPIALTNTLNVPRVANGVMSWMIARYPEIGITDDTLTPVVAECDDGRLNDIQGRHVS